MRGQSLAWSDDEKNSAKELGALVEINALHENEALSRTILNSIPERIAVLNTEGVIVAVNDAWQRFAMDYHAPELSMLSAGVRYQDISAAVLGRPHSDAVQTAWAGIAAVLNRQSDTFLYDYPYDSEDEQRWFRMSVYPVQAPAKGAVVVHQSILERKRAEAALARSEAHLQEAQNIASMGSWEWDITSGKNIWSDQQYRLFGYAPKTVHPSAELFDLALHPDDRAKVMGALEHAISDLAPYDVEYRIVLPDQSIRYQHSLGRLERDADGNPVCMTGTTLDITERQQVQMKLQHSQAMLARTEGNAHIGSWEWDVATDTVTWSDELFRIFQRDPCHGAPSFAEYVQLYDPQDWQRLRVAVDAAVNDGTPYELELRAFRKDGAIQICMARGHAEMNANKATRLFGSLQDITERKQMEEQVRQLAFHDTLTNLPNRRLLTDRLNQVMAASLRNALYGALMFIDLDHFKPLNDVHGHSVGDLLLIEVAKRLTASVREMDTVARFGGDEFVVVLSDLDVDRVESTSQARIVAEKIQAALSSPYMLKVKNNGAADGVLEHHCSASIGVVLFVNHETSQDDILKYADAAMYKAKDEGRNSIRFWEQPSS